MAFMITDDCINCGYCVEECPNSAIYEPGSVWTLEEGTRLKGIVRLMNGREVNACEIQDSLSDLYYFIVPEKCTECKGVYDEPHCHQVCPDPDCLVPHPDYKESKNELVDKQALLSV